MARQRMVTRTIHALDVDALCVNTETEELSTISVVISGEYSDSKKMEKAVQKAIDINNENTKLISIKNVSKRDTLYGMSEIEFVQHAEILPPRMADNSENDD